MPWQQETQKGESRLSLTCIRLWWKSQELVLAPCSCSCIYTVKRNVFFPWNCPFSPFEYCVTIFRRKVENFLPVFCLFVFFSSLEVIFPTNLSYETQKPKQNISQHLNLTTRWRCQLRTCAAVVHQHHRPTPPLEKTNKKTTNTNVSYTLKLKGKHQIIAVPPVFFFF